MDGNFSGGHERLFFCQNDVTRSDKKLRGNHFRPNFGLVKSGFSFKSKLKPLQSDSDLSGMKQDIPHFHFELDCFLYSFLVGDSLRLVYLIYEKD